MSSDILIWAVIILICSIIAIMYIARKPAYLRLPLSLLLIEVLLPAIALIYLATLPHSILYILMLASTPFLAIGLLMIIRLGKRVRTALEAHDEVQASALITPFVLTLPLVVWPVSPIYVLIQSSHNLQVLADLIGTLIFIVMLFLGGVRGAMLALREPVGWHSWRFVVSLVFIVVAIIFGYVIGRLMIRII